MIDLWGVLDFNRRGWGAAFVQSVLNATPAEEAVLSEILFDEPQIVLGGRRRRDEATPLVVGDQTLIVLGTVCEDLVRRTRGDEFDWDSVRADPPDGLYHLLLWDRRRQELRISSNILGARPLYYSGGNGTWLISTTLRSFRAHPAGRPALDRRALAETLALDHPLEDRTLLEGVTHVPAAEALTFRSTGMSHEPRTAAWSLPLSIARWSLDDSADALEHALEQSVQKWVGEDPRLNLMLTGGQDSRLLLPFLQAGVPRLEASTFGDADSDEVTVARELSRQAGLPHHVCHLSSTERLPPAELERLALDSEWFGDSAGPFYWRRWLRRLRENGAPAVSGYLGDTLGGAYLSAWGVATSQFDMPAAQAGADIAQYAASRAKAFAPFARPAVLDDLQHGLGSRIGEIYSRLAGDEVHTRLTAFDLSQRQRRYACWLPEVCERAVRTLHPFLSRTVVETFARMPLASRLDRAAVHRVIQRRMPAAMRLPDSNTGRLLKASSPLAHAWDLARHNRYTRRLASILGVPDMRVLSPFNRLIDAHRPLIATELRRSDSVLADYLDLPKAAAAAERDFAPYPAMRLYNVAVFTRSFYGD